MADIVYNNQKYYFISEYASERHIFGKLKCVDNPLKEIKDVISANFGCNILIPHDEGNIVFEFEGKKINPYNVDKYIKPPIINYRAAKETSIIKSQYGKKKYSGRYKNFECSEMYQHVDYAFETISIKPDLKLWLYQNPIENEAIEEKTEWKDRVPKLFSFYQSTKDDCPELQIIHAVDVNGESYVNIESLEDAILADIGDCANPFDVFCKSNNLDSRFIRKIPYGNIFQLIPVKSIEPLLKDKGNNYYKKHMSAKLVDNRRNYAGRYLYEYAKTIEKITNKEKRTLTVSLNNRTLINKKFSYHIKFPNFRIKEFTIYGISDMLTVEDKYGLSPDLNGAQDIIIDGILDLNTDNVTFNRVAIYNDETESYDEYNEATNYRQVCKVLADISLTVELGFRKIFNIWIGKGRVIEVPMVSRANPKNFPGAPLTIVRIEDQAPDDLKSNFLYVNLYSFVLNFCQSKKDQYFKSTLEKQLVPDLAKIFNDNEIIYYKYNSEQNDMVELEYYRELDIQHCYIELYKALDLLEILATESHNTYWFENANRFYKSFAKW